jgi:prevent-host-death family protein
MPITTLTSREFNQDTARAKRAAAKGPVVITDRGAPSHVLLSYDRYLALSGGTSDIAALLGMVEGADIDFEPPKAGIAGRSADLS